MGRGGGERSYKAAIKLFQRPFLLFQNNYQRKWLISRLLLIKKKKKRAKEKKKNY